MENNNQLNIKNEILALILADMRNRKLIMGLDAAGLSTDDFNTGLSVLILSKIGIAKEHEVLINNWYEDFTFTILDIELDAFRMHQPFLALTIYDALQEKGKELQVKFKSNPNFLQWTVLGRCDN